MFQHPVLEHAGVSICLGLERFKELMQYAGSPGLSIPAVQIAGSNGKGSVTKMLGSILSQSGYRVGIYTSPHLNRINERIVINNVEISDQDLNTCIERVDQVARIWSETLDQNMNSQNTLTYFEILTAAAFFYFEEQKVDIILLEVGLGGRLDATSIAKPLLSIIVSISLDHTEFLGPDLASIAMEKGGIIRTDTPVVVGDLPPEALRVIRMLAMDVTAPMCRLGVDFHLLPTSDSKFSVRYGEQIFESLEVSLAGAHQQKNAAISVVAASQLNERFPILWSSLRSALQAVQHPGRLEWISDRILLDCAHNVAGATQLANYLKLHEQESDRVLLLGVSNDKDIHSMWVQLEPLFDRIVLTQSQHHRALSPRAILQRLALDKATENKISLTSSTEDALEQIDFQAEELVVAGSIFLVGELRARLGHKLLEL